MLSTANTSPLESMKATQLQSETVFRNVYGPAPLGQNQKRGYVVM
jgi:hypothetical protein